jgi:hypothetical protein
VIVQLRWREPQQGEVRLFWVLTVHDGKILHIKDCQSRRDAEKRASRAA